MQERRMLPDFVLYIGDDRSDEDMFEAIMSSTTGPSLSPIAEVFACTVSQKPSKTTCYLDDTMEIVRLMQGLASVPEQAVQVSGRVPSTSGADAELTSEDEVIRLLNCTDHFSALGLLCYENIDIALLKREYRNKVLLDSLKREAYDDELKRKELLNWLKGLQSYQMSRRHGPFESRFPHSEGDDKDPLGKFRRIACKKWP